MQKLRLHLNRAVEDVYNVTFYFTAIQHLAVAVARENTLLKMCVRTTALINYIFKCIKLRRKKKNLFARRTFFNIIYNGYAMYYIIKRGPCRSYDRFMHFDESSMKHVWQNKKTNVQRPFPIIFLERNTLTEKIIIKNYNGFYKNAFVSWKQSKMTNMNIHKNIP